MANHVHLIVTSADADALSHFVKLTAQRYAQARNLRRDGSGKLFEERYRCLPILTDAQLAAATAYIDLNAYRAHLVEDFAAHRWSTYRLHAGLPDSAVPADLWTPSAWYLSLGATPAVRAARYRDFAAVCGALYRVAEAATPAEAEASPGYGRRLERPDRTRAAEDGPPLAPVPPTHPTPHGVQTARLREKPPCCQVVGRGERVP
jgi:REP element-mobilizing transposase RayT